MKKNKFNEKINLLQSKSINTISRFLSMFIYLTDNDSGYTSFSTRDIKIQPKKGRLLMFPPNWCYPHAGEKVTDKPKYIIGSYCHYMLDK